MNTAAEVAALRAEVAELRAALDRVILGPDAATLHHLLPLIRRVAGDRVWTLTDLAEAAVRAGDRDLAALLRAGPRRLGKLLARGEGLPVGGLAVHRVGDSRDGALWTCRRVSDH